MTQDEKDLIKTWFDHINQLATDRKTLTGEVMDDAHCLDEIKALAKNASDYIKEHWDNKEAWITYTVSTRPNVICGDAFADDDVIKQFNRSPQFEAGAEYGYNFAIEQACEWLDDELSKYVMEGREGKPYISVALIDEFKKAMKGE